MSFGSPVEHSNELTLLRVEQGAVMSGTRIRSTPGSYEDKHGRRDNLKTLDELRYLIAKPKRATLSLTDCFPDASVCSDVTSAEHPR